MKHSLLLATFCCFSLILLCGCPASKDSSTNSTTPSVPAESNSHAHNHDFGPDGGPLAVLGSHEYHAEAIANEESGDVEIRVYTTNNTPVTLEAKTVTINRIISGQPKQYTLSFVDEAKTATFKINDNELAETICDRKWEGDLQISLTLNDIPCSGNLSKKSGEHNHDHGHDHSH